MASTPTPSSERIRLTISVTPEVHAAFQRMAAAGSMSIGRAMGDWLGDTVEAVEYMASTMEKARAAPRLAVREIHAFALGLADETGDLLRRVSASRRPGGEVGADAPATAPGRRQAAHPPPSNTGGKGPQVGARKGGKASGNPLGGRS